MTQAQSIMYWLESAKRNIEAAKDNFELRHFDWALFLWHLTIEKTLKALLTKQEKIPAPTHDLYKLAVAAGLIPNQEQEKQLKEITSFNIEARYDDYKLSFYKKANQTYAKKWVEICKELYLWLLKKI